MSKSNSNDAATDAETVDPQTKRSLKQAVAAIRSRQADQQDVVVELKESEAARLDLLTAELQPLFDDIDESDDRFDIAVTRGERPRLWLDMTSFVAMGLDKRSYRFMKDTRMGRIVLAETSDMSKMADIVSNYIAERVLEREKMIEGEWVSLKDVQNAAASSTATSAPARRSTGRKGASRLLWFVFGALFGLGLLVAAAFVLVPDAF
jgi:hypothetical protein